MLNGVLNTAKNEWDTAVSGKTILIIALVIPLLVNLLLGFVFYNGQIRHIPMAVIDQDNSALSRMITKQFEENEIFDVKYKPEDSEKMKELLDNSQARVGMIIPKGFYNDMLELQAPSILMLYDGSHMSIASAAKARASEILLTLRTGALINLLEAKLNVPPDEAKKLALAVSFSNRTLYNPAKSFKNFLLPGFCASAVQAGIILMCSIAIRTHEITGRRKNRLEYLCGKILFYTVLGTVGQMVSIMIEIFIFGIPFKSSIISAIPLSIFYSGAVAAFSIMVSAWIRDGMIATSVNAILFLPNTVMSGYSWPILSMPAGYQKAASFIPFYHYADNIRDLFLKGVNLGYLMKDMAWFAVFIIATGTIGAYGVFRIKSTVVEDDGGRFEEGVAVETDKNLT